MIRRRELSPVEVVRAYLDRVEALDTKLRAFITVTADQAIAAARVAEKEVMTPRSKSLGAMHGVPIALKDLIYTRGTRTTAGSPILADFVPDADATVVTRLRDAGAITLGKTNLHEFAYGPEGINDHYGTTWNPWDSDMHRICGGSSSGSAAAVAAALCAGALGSDTGGSIRIPASLCGLSGIKPTYGRVSRAGAVPLAWSLDHIGPMCRSAADCALMLGIIAGHDPNDPTSSMERVPDYVQALTGDISGLRVGMLRASFLDSSGPEPRAAIETASATLASLGATVTDANCSTATLALGATGAVIGAEAFAYHREWLMTRWAEYSPTIRERLAVGAFFSGADYVDAMRARTMMRAEVDGLLSTVDVLLAPATPIAATPVGVDTVTLNGESQGVRPLLLRYTRFFNATGHPAASIPCGFTQNGLPIGLQIIGRRFDEATVLRVADAYQRATEWHLRRPPIQ